MHKVDITVVQSYPFSVDINSPTDTDYRGYLARENGISGTFNIGRTSDTGPGDVGDEVVNPPEGVIDGSIAFPPQSEANYNTHRNFRRIIVKLSGAEELERKERIGAFYVKGINDNGDVVKITAIKTASEGENYRVALTPGGFHGTLQRHFTYFTTIAFNFLTSVLCNCHPWALKKKLLGCPPPPAPNF